MHLEKFEAVKDKTAILYLYSSVMVNKVERIASTLVFLWEIIIIYIRNNIFIFIFIIITFSTVEVSGLLRVSFEQINI